MNFFFDPRVLISQPSFILAVISYVTVVVYLIIRAKKHFEDMQVHKLERLQLALDIVIAVLCVMGQPLYILPILLSNWPKKIKLLAAIPMMIFLVITFMWGISQAN